MPAIGNIAIADAVPATHTFAPVTTDGQTGKLANRSASIPAGFESLQLEMRPPSSQTAAYRLVASMANPTVGPVDGVDTVIRTANGSLTLNFSQQGTSQERLNQLKLWSNLLAHATVVSMVQNLEPVY